MGNWPNRLTAKMSEPTKILVVDDEPAILAATVRVLRSAGFDVLEAATGAGCLEVAKEHRPDLILLDVVLPDIDGRDVCRELKGDPALTPTFVVLTSGERKSADDRVAGLDVGADGYILRPVGNRELLAWVETFVRISQAEAALRHAQQQIEQRHALSVAASLDGMWEWDIASGRAQYSDRFAELLGYRPGEVPSTVDFLRGIIHPDDAEAMWAAVERHLEDRAPYSVEGRLRSKGGEHRWFLARGQAQWDPTGRATWMAGSIQDITEQKTAELALRNAFGEIEQLRDRLRAENIYLREEIESSHDFNEIVGQSDPLKLTLSKIEHVAGTEATVLLLGETGTGKELLARAIHDRSARRERPLVKVNCAALPRSLIESELFGHVKGAFTGAVADKVGRFQLADGGSIFLDEIGELDPDLQTKLLRVLQEGQFERIGSGETLQVDVRVIAATNRDLSKAMSEERFRPDLYYRLAVFPIEVPPLRLRRDDIPLLAWHFITRRQGQLGKAFRRIPTKIMNSLVEYHWPGNIRELENVIERSMILSPGPDLLLAESLSAPPAVDRPETFSGPLKEVDRAHIVGVLEECKWKIKGADNAAERLGLKPSTLRYRMKKLGIERPPRRPR
jgi:PAS domain S-box-containing protein